MKIAVVGTVGIPAKYGGFETLVDHLVKNLPGKYDLHVYCSAKIYPERETNYNRATLHYVPLNPNGIQSIPYDIFSILHSLIYANVILILGVSGCIFLPIVKFFCKKKIIVNIDGLEWRREKWNPLARKFLKYSELLAVRFADNIIADNKSIQNYLLTEYGRSSHLIAYGGDHAKAVPVGFSLSSRWPFILNDYAFTVCRIEPENNIHLILAAFRASGIPFVLVGNWDNCDYGKTLRKEYSDTPNLFLLDPIYDQDQLDSLRSNCKLYIHGHSAGGTNPSLVEAMWLGLPIVCFDVSYNRETTENKSFYFRDVSSLVAISLRLMKNSELTVLLRSDMKDIACLRYRWKTIVEQYSEVFEQR